MSGTLSIGGGTITGGHAAGLIPLLAPSLVDQGGGNIEVTGGRFLSPIVTSFQVGDNSRLDFFGTGLAYSNGLITGTLANGDVINQVVQTTNTTVVVNSSLTELSFLPATAPEPSSIVLIALGLGGAGLIARMRRAEG